ncbi:pridected protein [Bacillus sp. OxB-1]|nr:pridected protein [Bacillus sp. OxB-1]
MLALELEFLALARALLAPDRLLAFERGLLAPRLRLLALERKFLALARALLAQGRLLALKRACAMTAVACARA